MKRPRQPPQSFPRHVDGEDVYFTVPMDVARDLMRIGFVLVETKSWTEDKAVQA